MLGHLAISYLETFSCLRLTHPFTLLSVKGMGSLSNEVLVILNLTIRIIASGVRSVGSSFGGFVQLLQVTNVRQSLLKQHNAEFKKFMLEELLSWHSLNPLD